MARVLAPGGQLMIYVWAMEQKNRHFEKQDVLVPWNRALCSRLLSESHQSWGHSCEHPTSQGYQGPGSACSCAVCFKGRCDSKRSHSMDYGPAVARTCCEAISKEGQQENGLYSNFGKSFRSWFFSRSLDESTLRKQIERVRPMKIEGWANSTVSHQPSRYPSVDLHAQEPFSTKRLNLDEVFVDASSQRHVGCLGVPSTSDNFIGHKGGESRRKEGGNFLDTTDTGNSVAARNGGDRSARKILRRVSAFDSTDSTSEDPSFVEGQQDGPDSKAFMRYYHVFREGELSSLLQECVSELQVLSSGNDHGNWCIIAEKKRSWD